MKFNTGFYCSSDVNKYDCTTDRPIVRPELSFTIKEISQRFTLQNLIVEGQRSNPLYNGDSTDVDFDQPSVNVPPMYDLVDARNDTMRVVNARNQVLEAMKKKSQTPPVEPAPPVDPAPSLDPAPTE